MVSPFLVPHPGSVQAILVDMTSTAIRPQGPKLLQQLREALRAHHYNPRTEEAYVAWVRRYVRFHGLRHPGELGESEIRQFLTALAVRGQLSASRPRRSAQWSFCTVRCCVASRVTWAS
jgi:Phage integrase, N-terminal SAM-like domain